MKDQKIDWTDYVKQTAKLLNLNLNSQNLPGVVDNFSKIEEIASLITEFDLPEEIEAAPKFEP